MGGILPAAALRGWQGKGAVVGETGYFSIKLSEEGDKMLARGSLPSPLATVAHAGWSIGG